MSQQNTARLGALTGKWNVPGPEKLKAVLQPDREVEDGFYASDLGRSARNSAATSMLERKTSAQEKPAEAHFEIYCDDEGTHRWRLRGADGTVLAESGASYPGRASCRAAIRLVRKVGSSAGVKEPA